MKQKAIYPEIDIQILYMGGKTLVTLETFLRKTYRGKYYLWKFWKEFETVGDLIGEEAIVLMKRFNKEVYRTIILGKVDPKLVLHTGGICRPAFELDTDQTPEHVRLIQTQLLLR
jgi:hypothetical protein